MTAPVTSTRADLVLAAIDDHDRMEMTKRQWRCKCGVVIAPFVDFKPVDQRLHRRHLAEAIAELELTR